jgi:hypothetical protein
MKNSNKILTGLLVILLITTIGIDFLLENRYTKINLNDPYKNYEQVAIHPFKHLKIKGGNAYTIEIRQAANYDMKVMVSRKTFLTTILHGDTLLINFSVASNPMNHEPEGLPRGIIINAPVLSAIIAEGCNTIIRDVRADSLQLILSGNSASVLHNVHVGNLAVSGRQNALVNFRSHNQAATLKVCLTEGTSAFLEDISYSNFHPLLSGDSKLIFGAQTAAKLQTK